MINMSGDLSFQDPTTAGGYGFADGWLFMRAASAQPHHDHDAFVAAHHQDEVFTAEHESENADEVEEEDETGNQRSVPVPVLVPAIGTVLYDGKFKCNMPMARCSRATFGRMHELRRHYDTVHVAMRQFWCVEPFCERTAAAGGKPFPRLDKLRDHERKKHHLGPNAT
jgi:hypothetical protein